MKVKNYLILWAIALPFSLIAQENDNTDLRVIPSVDAPKAKRFEIGFNTTPLIKQVFNLSGNNLPQSPYDFSVRYYFRNNTMAYRFGTGIRYHEEKDVDILSGGATGSETKFKEELYAFRNGVEWIKPINKRLKTHLGADFIYTYRNNGSSNSFNDLSDKTTLIGGGPVLGLNFELSKSFSLYTETSIYVAQAKTVNDRKQRPASKTTSEGTTKTLTSILPTTLYLTFRF